MTTASAVIVVGVDGTPAGDAALTFAIDEATRSSDSVEMVTAWDTDVTRTALDVAYGVVMSEAERQAKAEAERLQQKALQRVLADAQPAVVISGQVVRGRPGPVLVEAARPARLLIVGTRALGPVRAALLGSTSRYCARHASGPLAVVPAAPAADHVSGTGTADIVRADWKNRSGRNESRKGRYRLRFALKKASGRAYKVGPLECLWSLAALDRIRLTRFDEGLCGQILHIGPYSTETAT
jgi:nucleotide-binding universal stress UspA family protein